MAQIITKITTQKRKGRFNIFINNQYAFAVSESTLIRFTLSKGQELSPAEIEQITQADEVAKAYQKTLNYLSYKLRTQKEINQFLNDFELSKSDREEIIDKLCELNLIDDLNYAKSYVRTQMRINKLGPQQISQKLKLQQIDPELITEALLEYPYELQLENGCHLAEKIARKYQKDAFFIRQNKIKVNLLKKGYSGDLINEIIAHLDLQPDEDAEQAALTFQADKLLRRYNRTHPDQVANKLKQALYKKGFSLSQIQTYLDEHLDEQF